MSLTDTTRSTPGCRCYPSAENKLIVCDACASAQIEARNAPLQGSPGALPRQDHEIILLAFASWLRTLTPKSAETIAAEGGLPV